VEGERQKGQQTKGKFGSRAHLTPDRAIEKDFSFVRSNCHQITVWALKDLMRERQRERSRWVSERAREIEGQRDRVCVRETET
jgi:hypothetical protein